MLSGFLCFVGARKSPTESDNCKRKQTFTFEQISRRHMTASASRMPRTRCYKSRGYGVGVLLKKPEGVEKCDEPRDSSLLFRDDLVRQQAPAPAVLGALEREQ